ncbi:hypothetical protein BsWGS_12631 [Bradybaena similaris]
MLTTATLPLILAMFSSLALMCDFDLNTSSSTRLAEIMYEWVQVEFYWPSEEMRRQFEANGSYNPAHNLISGIKTYKGQVYVTVPRLKYTTGVPSTLNKVVVRDDEPLLTPFPNWQSQKLGDCTALQCAMSMEVDPITGYMYVIDPGRSGIFGNVSGQPEPVICPPKLVVYDLKDGRMIRSHNFPEDLVSNQTNFLNDIVLDRGSANSTTAKWVYITDAVDPKLIVFNLDNNRTHVIYHSSMDFEPGDGSNITVNGISYILRTPIDGLAMSSDFEYVYYCALGSKNLYQVPTSVVRGNTSDFGSHVRLVGAKTSQTGGMTYGTDNLYYGALTRNSVFRWEVTKDAQAKGGNFGLVEINSETEIARDDEMMQWPDSFTVDEEGYLWFTACRAHLFLLSDIDFSGRQGSNYRIWRVNITENGYLAPRAGSGETSSGANSWRAAPINVIPLFVLAWRQWRN